MSSHGSHQRQLNTDRSTFDGLSLTMGGVWLLGVLFALGALVVLIGGYALEQHWLQRETNQAQLRLGASWAVLKKQVARGQTPRSPDGIIWLRFSVAGQLQHPFNLATPTPPVTLGSGASSLSGNLGIYSADSLAHQRWRRALAAQRSGDISQALGLLKKIPSMTFTPSGLPLDLLALYRRWRLNDPNALPLLLRKLKSAHHSLGVRIWMLKQLQTQPALRETATAMLHSCTREAQRWQGLAPPGRGQWRASPLDGRQGILLQSRRGPVAWLPLQVLRKSSESAWRPLVSSGRITVALSLRKHPKDATPPAATSLLVAGPLQLSVEHIGWFKGAVVAAAAGVVGVVLFFLVLAGFGMRRMFQRERALLREQQRFAAAVTHELRSPLTSLALTTELLSTNEVPRERLPRYHERLDQQVQRLHGVVENVISYYRDPQSEQAPRGGGCGLYATMEELVGALTPLTDRAGVRLQVQYHNGTEQALPIDADTLSRIIHNLVDNALKHAPKSDISIDVGPGPSITLSDRGPGIPDQIQGQIFQPFTQGPQQADTRQGLGLGLAFVHDAMQRAGGSVRLRSAPETGTSFLLDWSATHGD